MAVQTLHSTDCRSGRHNSKWLRRHDSNRHNIKTIHSRRVDCSAVWDPGDVTHKALVVRWAKVLHNGSHWEWEDDTAEHTKYQCKCSHHSRHTFVFIWHISATTKNTEQWEPNKQHVMDVKGEKIWLHFNYNEKNDNVYKYIYCSTVNKVQNDNRAAKRLQPLYTEHWMWFSMTFRDCLSDWLSTSQISIHIY